MIHNRLINLKCYLAKQAWDEQKERLTLVTCKSFPDYDPVENIGDKFIQNGAD